jgi:hypothetical protein
MIHMIHNGGVFSLCLGASYIIVRGVLGTAIDVVNWLIRLSCPRPNDI